MVDLATMLALFIKKTGGVLTGRFTIGGGATEPTTAWAHFGNPVVARINAVFDFIFAPTNVNRGSIQILIPRDQIANVWQVDEINGNPGTGVLTHDWIDANGLMYGKIATRKMSAQMNFTTNGNLSPITEDNNLANWFQALNKTTAGTSTVVLNTAAQHFISGTGTGQRFRFQDVAGIANTGGNKITINAQGTDKIHVPGDATGVSSITIEKPFGYVEMVSLGNLNGLGRWLVTSKDNV